MMRCQIRRVLLCSCAALIAVGFTGNDLPAEELRVENVHLIKRPQSTGELRAVMDISWRSGWRNERNYDAAWIFLKFVRPGNGYTHVKLAPAGHRASAIPGGQAPDAQIQIAADSTGFFISAAREFRGDPAWRVSVRLAPSAADARFRRSQLQAFGIEMVYIPDGGFTLGDPDTTALRFGAFYKAGRNGSPDGLVRVDSETASLAVGPNPGQLYYRSGNARYEGDQLGPVPPGFPKGVRPFYVMKYEVTQGNYADFLNTLSNEATFERFTFGGRSYASDRGTISLEGDRFAAADRNRPLNYASWDGSLAFADWAALRPWTELEYTKASRGPAAPKPGAFPWGTASRQDLAREVVPSGKLHMTNGWDESRLNDATRPVFGASYYWVMDLAGGVWERVITIGLPGGRAFTGSHGDGNLGSRARATNTDWPHEYSGTPGHGYRGGGFYDTGMTVHEFNPHSPVAYRRFGAWPGSYPMRAYGFRCARTADR